MSFPVVVLPETDRRAQPLMAVWLASESPVHGSLKKRKKEETFARPKTRPHGPEAGKELRPLFLLPFSPWPHCGHVVAGCVMVGVGSRGGSKLGPIDHLAVVADAQVLEVQGADVVADGADGPVGEKSQH